MRKQRNSSKEPAIPEPQRDEMQSSENTLTAEPHLDTTRWENMTAKELRERTTQAAEAQKKRRMIEYLRDLDAGKEPALDPSVLQESRVQDGNSKRQRTHAWGKIQLPTPSFKGKSWTELQIYLTHLSTQFDMEPDQFEDDPAKIQYASSCLDGDMKRRWTWYWSQECDRSYDNLTYKKYVRWCEDNLSGAETRALDATAKLDYMRQGDTEKFQSFLQRFEAAHSEIPARLPDIYRIALAIHKCLPEIRKNIISQGFPDNWQQLRSYGINAEAMLDQYGGNSNNSQRPRNNRFQYEQRSNKDSEKPEPTGDLAASPQDKRKSNVICYKCGVAGHYSNRCEEPDCSQCGDGRHTDKTHNNPVKRNLSANPAKGANQEPVSARRA
jgi:hypothetical protein